MIKTLFMIVFWTTLQACGADRPDASILKDQISRGQSQGVQAAETDKNQKAKTRNKAKTDNAKTKPDGADRDADKKDTKPAETPEGLAAKLPLRTAANETEIANAKTAYGTDCAGCHQALAMSAKKGRNLNQINAAVNVQAHQTIATKWPKNIPDSTDDGVDSAMLKASAMVEALK